MMKFMLYLFFLIPVLCFNFSVFYIQFMYVLLYFLFAVVGLNSFYSCISYFIGVDYFSYGLICLSIIIISFMLITVLEGSVFLRFYLFVSIILLFFMLLVFSSLSFLYMYISFEFVLFPLMILILGWGIYPERLVAGLYMFFYTLFASLPLLVVILINYLILGSFFFDYLYFYTFSLFNSFFLVFAFFVSVPMFMFHFWLPKAHVQAPVSGSMVLAGLMLSIGGYGLIRVLGINEYSFMFYSWFWLGYSMVGSIFVGLLCFMQEDLSILVAYSSVSHMGFCIVGLLTMNACGFLGGYLLMIGHGFCSSGLFYLVSVFYSRSLSRSFYVNSGILLYIPSCSLFWFFLCSFNMGCPPSLNFISEVLILISLVSYWGSSFWYFILYSFICACFSYYLYGFMHNGIFYNVYGFSNMSLVEIFCVLVHLFPLVFISLSVLVFV